MENPSIQTEKPASTEIYRLTRSEILAAIAVLLTLIGGAVRLTRDTSGDTERQTNRVLDLCTKSIGDAENRSRALIVDLETRTTRALADAEARADRQIGQVSSAISKRIDPIESYVAKKK